MFVGIDNVRIDSVRIDNVRIHFLYRLSTELLFLSHNFKNCISLGNNIFLFKRIFIQKLILNYFEYLLIAPIII